MSDAFQPKFNSLVEVFEHSVGRYADRPLFGTKTLGAWRWMSYRDFGAQVDALRAGLATLGIGPGDRVAIIANNRPEWAVAAYATYGRRGAFVPMYESQLAKDWKYILADCDAKVVFTSSPEITESILTLKEDLPALSHVVGLDHETGHGEGSMSYQELLQAGRGQPSASEHPEAEEVAGFIYTSGTTGQPKGVKLSHRNLASNISAIHEVFPMEPEDRSLSFLPWAHSFGQTVELHGLLSMGASIGIAESIPQIIANLSEVRPTLLFSVPRIFNKLHARVLMTVQQAGGLKKAMFDAALNNAQKRKHLASQGRRSGLVDLQHRVLDKLVLSKIRDRFGGRLKYAFSGGAAISKEVAEFIDALGITVYEGYGLTETSPIASCNWPGARKIGSVGKPIPGVRIEIDRQVTGDPKHGEIIVHGHNVMLGYHNLPEEDAKVFKEDGGFRTGDMGYIDEQGFLHITGRIKEQYKLENGKYVVPAPLEEQLKLSPYIASAFLYGMNKPYNVALIVPDMETLEPWAKERGIQGGPAEWVQERRVKELIEGEVRRFCEDFKHYEQPKKVTLISEDFSVENGMLTPKMSVKRRVVLERWGDTLAGLYSKS